MPQRESAKTSSLPPTLHIAVIGDVHDAWDAEDAIALEQLGVDLVLFVGDFGNESVGVVRQVASVNLPKAVVLGNHDAWFSATEWGMRKCPYDRTQEDWVQQQLDALGSAHVGYAKLDFADLEVSVVGARPFSWGGSEWKTVDFYKTRYGVENFTESTAKILQAVQQATSDHLIFIGHCGPLGLGDRPEDICGKDWQPLGGDHGDPDFAEAIAQARQLGKHIPLVAFGHMHHHLRHTKDRLRQRVAIDAAGTVYVNAACVPRIVRHLEGAHRNFTIVTLEQQHVTEVALVWLDQHFNTISKEILYAGETANLSSVQREELISPSSI